MTVRVSVTQNLEACFAIRHTVFVEEQKIPVELERDALDDTAIHVLATVDGVPRGTARIVVQDGTGKIGRVAVLQEARGAGLGAALIRCCLATFRETPNVSRATLGAQVDALGFYEGLGFSAYGNVFEDAGMDHRMMELRFDT